MLQVQKSLFESLMKGVLIPVHPRVHLECKRKKMRRGLAVGMVMGETHSARPTVQDQVAILFRIKLLREVTVGNGLSVNKLRGKAASFPNGMSLPSTSTIFSFLDLSISASRMMFRSLFERI